MSNPKNIREQLDQWPNIKEFVCDNGYEWYVDEDQIFRKSKESSIHIGMSILEPVVIPGLKPAMKISDKLVPCPLCSEMCKKIEIVGIEVFMCGNCTAKDNQYFLISKNQLVAVRTDPWWKIKGLDL